MYLDENICIKYHEFEPNDEVRAAVNKNLGNLFEEAPGDCGLWAQISTGREGYKVMVHINSSEGSQYANSTGRDISAVTDEVAAKIREQLEEWRKHRFN